MCVPLAALALVAAGSVAKYFGEKQAQKAQNRTFNRERDRQNDMTDLQTARFQDSLNKTNDMLDPTTAAKAAATREGTLANAIIPSANTAYLPGSSSAPSVVATAADGAAATSRETSLGLAHTLAALGGTTDQLQGLNIGIGRNSEGIGQLAGFKAGSMGVLDAEMKAAAQKGSFLRGIGGLAQTIGSAWMGGAGGFSGAPMSGAAIDSSLASTNGIMANKLAGFGGAF